MTVDAMLTKKNLHEKILLSSLARLSFNIIYSVSRDYPKIIVSDDDIQFFLDYAKIKLTKQIRYDLWKLQDRFDASPDECRWRCSNRQEPLFEGLSLANRHGYETGAYHDSLFQTARDYCEILRQYKYGSKSNGYVYFLLLEADKSNMLPYSLVKIGYTNDKNSSRTKEIHSHCPWDLVLLGTIPVLNLADEKRIHDQLKKHRHNREWFYYDDIVQSSINDMLDYGVVPITNIDFSEYVELSIKTAKYNSCEFGYMTRSKIELLHDINDYINGHTEKILNWTEFNQ